MVLLIKTNDTQVHCQDWNHPSLVLLGVPSGLQFFSLVCYCVSWWLITRDVQGVVEEIAPQVIMDENDEEQQDDENDEEQDQMIIIEEEI